MLNCKADTGTEGRGFGVYIHQVKHTQDKDHLFRNLSHTELAAVGNTP